ncbi:MAG: ROK family transcriptional regulator [Actinomycetales bacterium]
MRRPSAMAAAAVPGQRSLRLTAKALPTDSRQHNRSLLLQELFHNGAMSRADLARRSGLTPVTVSNLVKELLRAGLVEDQGATAAGGVGKPATLIALRRQAFQILSVDLSGDDVFVGAVVDLEGNVVRRHSVTSKGRTGRRAVDLVTRVVGALVEFATAPILGIGIATPGIVDNRGRVLSAPNLKWTDVNLAGLLEERFELPVRVENDADAEALAARSFGRSSGNSLMVVTIKHGVGAGLVLGDMLIHGDDFAAGEIGHVVVDEAGETCSCGRRGCLEVSLAVPSLRRRFAGRSESEREEVLVDAGRALGAALAPITSALNLNEVILSGPAELLDGPLRDSALDTIRAKTLAAVSSGLQLSVDTSGDLALLGAAVLVLHAELGVA